ncbi:hypothetical protein ABKN59_001605 [Abortiporus biennis]
MKQMAISTIASFDVTAVVIRVMIKQACSFASTNSSWLEYEEFGNAENIYRKIPSANILISSGRYQSRMRTR